MSSIFGTFVPPDQSLSTTSSPEFASLTVDGEEVLTEAGGQNITDTLTTTQTVFTTDQEIPTKKYVDDAITGAVPSLTDLETKTQNIDLLTSPGITVITGNVNPDLDYTQDLGLNPTKRWRDVNCGRVQSKTIINQDDIECRDIYANSFVKNLGTATEFLKADGTVDTNTYLTSGSTEITDLQDKTQNITGSVNLTDFTGDIRFDRIIDDVGGQLMTAGVDDITITAPLTVASITKTGGLSTEFLKADGSVDSNTYLTSATYQDIYDNSGTPTETQLTNGKDIIFYDENTGAGLTIKGENNGGILAPRIKTLFINSQNPGGDMTIGTDSNTLTLTSMGIFMSVPPIITGGTSSDFLKGDGTLDTRKYLSDTFSQTADKTVGNTVAETSIIGTGVGSMTILSSDIYVGEVYKLCLSGYMDVNSSPLMTWRLKFGATTIVTSVYTMQAIPADSGWHIEYHLCFRTLGVSGTCVVTGLFHYSDSSLVNQESVVKVGTTTVDTTVNSLLDLTVQWGTADANNTITSQICTLSNE